MKLIQLDSILTSTAGNDWEYDDKTVSYTYKDDVCLRIQEDIDTNEFDEPWVKTFSAPATISDYVIYYNSSILRRYKIIAVDGGRALLPMPIAGTTQVKNLDDKVARILHDASGNSAAGYDYDKYFKQAGLIR